MDDIIGLNTKKITEEIKALDNFNRLILYMHYYVKMISLKHDFYIIDNLGRNKTEHHTIYKEVGNLSFLSLWRDSYIHNFESFFSEENIKIVDNGEKWQEMGWSARWRINLGGAYEWFWKFKNEINFK